MIHLICMPEGWNMVPVAGSELGPWSCTECGVRVWVSPQTRHLLDAGEAEPRCLGCSLRDPEFVEALEEGIDLLPGQAEALRAHVEQRTSGRRGLS